MLHRVEGPTASRSGRPTAFADEKVETQSSATSDGRSSSPLTRAVPRWLADGKAQGWSKKTLDHRRQTIDRILWPLENLAEAPSTLFSPHAGAHPRVPRLCAGATTACTAGIRASRVRGTPRRAGRSAHPQCGRARGGCESTSGGCKSLAGAPTSARRRHCRDAPLQSDCRIRCVDFVSNHRFLKSGSARNSRSERSLSSPLGQKGITGWPNDGLVVQGLPSRRCLPGKPRSAPALRYGRDTRGWQAAQLSRLRAERARCSGCGLGTSAPAAPL